MTLRKLDGTEMEVTMASPLDENERSKKWRIPTGALAKRLEKKAIELVEDGDWLNVIAKE